MSFRKIPAAGVAPTWAKGLDEREWRFVEEYMVDLNSANAIRRAGFNGKAKNSAASRGWEMLAKPHVAEAIETLMSERGVTRVWIVDQYARIAHATLDDFMTVKDGVPVAKDWDEIDPELIRLVESFEKTEHGIKIKLVNSRPAVDRLAKILRMEVERTEISGPNGGPVEVSDPKARIQARLEAMAKKLADDGA